METDTTPTDQTFVTGSHAVASGTVVARRYRTDVCLASGGYGDVWKGVDLRSGAPIALKILRTDAGNNDPSAIARMRQEAEILKAMDHPNIVRVFGFGNSPYGHYLAMEFLDGLAIDQWLTRKGAVDEEMLIPIARQLLEALADAHDKHILHRDLKPENIILVKDATQPNGYRAILVDFGIAKAQQLLNDGDEGATLVQTRAGGFMGTPRYAAPEQAVGDPCGPNIDLFALGLVLAEWLTGRMRIDGEKHSDVMTQLLSPDPIDMSDCPRRWQRWLYEMTRKNPAQRYRDAAAAIAGLDELVVNVHRPADFVDHDGHISSYGQNSVPGGFLSTDGPLEVDFERARAVKPSPPSMPAMQVPQPAPPPPTTAAHAAPNPAEAEKEREYAQAAFFVAMMIVVLLVVSALMFLLFD